MSDGSRLVVLHQATVTGHVGAEDCGELAVKAFLFHADTPFCRRFGESKMGELNPKGNPVRSEPLDETSVRFRSGGKGRILQSE